MNNNNEIHLNWDRSSLWAQHKWRIYISVFCDLITKGLKPLSLFYSSSSVKEPSAIFMFGSKGHCWALDLYRNVAVGRDAPPLMATVAGETRLLLLLLR